jgi:hypothetical protein
MKNTSALVNGREPTGSLAARLRWVCVHVVARSPFTKEAQTKPFGGFTMASAYSRASLLFFSSLRKKKKKEKKKASSFLSRVLL